MLRLFRNEKAGGGHQRKDAPDLLLPEAVQEGLNTSVLGGNIIHYDRIGSTNTEAKQLAAEGVPEGTVVVAEEQDGGRGRLERSFFSPRGGLWFSVILRPPFPPREAPKCTLLAAVAVARAMERFDCSVGIKWPNDILYRGRKLVGILTEMDAERDRVRSVILGTGINVNIPEEDFPEDLRETATSLQVMKGEEIPRIPFFQGVLEAMESLYLTACREGFAPVLEAWRQYAVTLGQEVRVIGLSQGETFTGKAVDIDEEGALLIDTEAGRRRFVAGDVSIRTGE